MNRSRELGPIGDAYRQVPHPHGSSPAPGSAGSIFRAAVDCEIVSLPEHIDASETDSLQPHQLVKQICWMVFGLVLGDPFAFYFFIRNVAAHEGSPLMHVRRLQKVTGGQDQIAVVEDA